MSTSRIEVLGAHRLRVTDELVRDEAECRYGEPRAEDEAEVRRELSAVVLVEVLVHHPDSTFDVGDFTQPEEGTEPAGWQVAWNEVYLSADGASVVEAPARGTFPATLRIAFFMHCWQADVPLQSSYGVLTCPATEEMPERLDRLIPYMGVD